MKVDDFPLKGVFSIIQSFSQMRPTKQSITRIAEIVLRQAVDDSYQYIHDPDHRSRPHGTFWPTEKGWSNDPKDAPQKEKPSNSPFDAEMKKKNFTVPKQAQGALRRGEAELVWVNVPSFDRAFQSDPDSYIGRGGAGGIGSRYSIFSDYFKNHKDIDVSEAVVKLDHKGNPSVEFVNGRHRWAYMRDQGATKIPVVLYIGDGVLDVSQSKKHGLIAQ